MIITIANQKGGVGKTTTTVALAYNLHRMGKRVCVIDTDPQANTTSTFGISPDDAIGGMFAYMEGEVPLVSAVQTTSCGVDVVPSHIGLAHSERGLYAGVNREQRLAAEIGNLEAEYDIILIDSPPSLGLLTYNALAACDTVLAPIHTEPYALDGITMLLDTLSDIRKYGLNDNCRLGGAVLTLVDRRRNIDARASDVVREALGDVVFETSIPRDVKLVEMTENADLSILDGHSSAAIAYRMLAREVTEKWIV